MNRISKNTKGRFRSRRSTAAALAVLSLTFSFCRGRSRPDHFILITLDTQRADHIGPGNPAGARTPNLDAIAAQATVFRRAYSPIPITLPAHASIFYSEQPSEIKSYNNGQVISPRRSRPSVVNLFRKQGFATAAFVSLGVLAAHYGLAEGFETYDDRFPPDRWYLSAGEVNERAFLWLEKNSRRPFFLWLHYSDPHDPYAPPYSPQDFKLFLNGVLVYETSLQKYLTNVVDLHLRPGKNTLRLELENEFDPNPEHFLGRLDLIDFVAEEGLPAPRVDYRRGWFIRRPDNVYFFMGRSEIEIHNPGRESRVRFIFRGKPLLSIPAARTCYKREVEYMDGEIGRLWRKLEELQLASRTALLIVGDHGEGLGEYHNDFGDPHVGHIHFLYDVYMRVPLIIRLASQTKTTARDDVVSLMDIAPTICGIMGFKSLPSFEGRDLLRFGQKDSAPLFQETYRPEATRDRFALLSPPWHLLFTPEEGKFELFNLDSDPGETTNLIEADRPFPASVLTLKQKIETLARDALSLKPDVRVDDKTREMLRALGYVR